MRGGGIRGGGGRSRRRFPSAVAASVAADCRAGVVAGRLWPRLSHVGVGFGSRWTPSVRRMLICDYGYGYG